ncbi:MAG: hypothetical protein ACI4U5_03805 [Bacilli bacterium]
MNKKKLILSSLLLLTSLVGCSSGKKNSSSTINTSIGGSTSVVSNTLTNSDNSNGSSLTVEDVNTYQAYRSAMKSLEKNNNSFSYYGDYSYVEKDENDQITQNIVTKNGCFYNPKNNEYEQLQIGTVNDKEYNFRQKTINYPNDDSEQKAVVGIEKIDSDIQYYSHYDDGNYDYPTLGGLSKLFTVSFYRMGENSTIEKDNYSINNIFKSEVNLYSEYKLDVTYNDDNQILIIELTGEPSTSLKEEMVPDSKYYVHEKMTFMEGILTKYELTEKTILLKEDNTSILSTTEITKSYNVSSIKLSAIGNTPLTSEEIDIIKTKIRNVVLRYYVYSDAITIPYYLTTADTFDKIIHEEWLDKYPNIKATMIDGTNYDKSKIESFTGSANIIITLEENND